MELSVWFNPRNECFKVHYMQTHTHYKIGYVNANGHLLVAYIYYFDGKVFFSPYELEKYATTYLLKRQSFRDKLLNHCVKHNK